MHVENFHIWPTTISVFKLDTAKDKDYYMKALYEYFKETGIAEESTGAVYLHNNANFAGLFEKVGESVRQRFDSLGLSHSNLDFNITKCWPNVLKRRATPNHNHKDAHVSFSFYLNVPNPASQSIDFVLTNNQKHPNEPYQSFMSHGVETPNFANATRFSHSPAENALLVFPSDVNHETSGVIGYDGSREVISSLEDLYSARVCIAGDIVVSYKETHTKSTGLQPVNTWRRF